MSLVMYRLKSKVDHLQKDLSIALTQAREQEREKLKSQEGLRIAEEKALEVRYLYLDIYKRVDIFDVYFLLVREKIIGAANKNVS